jgi:hypothetical protein
MPRPSITFSDALFAAAKILSKRRKYRGIPEYLNALVRYDGQTQRDHVLTDEWAAMDAAERDRLDEAILRQVKTGKGVRGSWLEARMEAIIRKIMAERTEPPTVKEVTHELARAIAEQPNLAD